MKIEFDADQQPLTNNMPETRTNFVSRLLIKTSLVSEPKTANLLSMILAIGLLILCMASLLNLLVPEEIDSRFYYDPATAEPDAQ